MEIPTYPYEKELLIELKLISFYIKEIFNRKKLRYYIDRIAVFTDDKELFGVPTLRFTNGIDLSKINPVIPKEKKDDCINLCAVSSFEKWHGYERVLKSMGEYYANNGKQNIVFHMVGDGTEMKLYKDTVERYNIQNHVIFYGRQYGQALDDIYNITDVAVDVFGMYRKNNEVSCSLKSREYLAKGLPVISGCMIDVLEDVPQFEYFKQFPNNNTLIDINDIVDFYKKAYECGKSKEAVVKIIREFAEETCGMDKGLHAVTEYLSGN